MKALINLFIKRPVAVILIAAAMIGFGIFATVKMPINLLPDMSIPMLGVSVTYPGASAATVEEEVTVKLEDALKTTSGLTSLNTMSMNNVATVIMEFDYDIDLKVKTSDIQSLLDSLSLPTNANKPNVINVDFNSAPAATVGIFRDDGDMIKLGGDAESFKSKLVSIDGVGQVTLSGMPKYELNITPKQYGMEAIDSQLNSAILMIVQALQADNLNIPLGTITDNGETISIRNLTSAQSIADIAKIPVSLPPDKWLPMKPFLTLLSMTQPNLNIVIPADTDNIILTLSIFADIPLSPSLMFESISYINGKKGINLEVGKTSGANTSGIVEQVKSFISSSTLSSEIILLDDQAEFIDDSVGNVLSSMLIGGALAIIIIFLFLRSVKSSVIISITMPLSVLAALICLFLMGVSLNMVSLGGLAVGIGMLVDNSIVVIESITRRRDKGDNAYKASLLGTAEVGGSILASTLTTICVFFPIMFAGGLTREIFKDLSLSVIFSLSFSLLVAVFVIPCLYSLWNGGRKYFLKGSSLNKSAGGVNSDLTTDNLVTADESETSLQPTEINADVSETSLQTAEINADVSKTSLQTAETNAEGINQSAELEKSADGISSKHKLQKQKKVKIKRSDNSSGKIMTAIENAYAKILPKALKRRLPVLIVALILFVGSIGLIFTTGTEFLPSIDKGLIEVNLDFSSSTALNDAFETTDKLEKLISGNVDGIETISSDTGSRGILAVSNTGYIRIQLKKSGKTADTVEQIRQIASDNGIDATVSEVDGVVAMITSGLSGLSLSIKGDDTEVLKEISDKIQTSLQSEKGFSKLSDDMSEKTRQYNVEFDKQKCLQKGVDYQTAVMTLYAGLSGIETGNILHEGNSVSVKVSFKEGLITNLNQLNDFPLSNGVYLKDVAAVTETYSSALINRADGKYVLNITAQTYGLDTGSATTIFQNAADNVLKDYDGYSYETSGVSSYLSDAFGGLIIALIVSVFLLYAIMAIQFESFLKPLVVMTSIPLSFTGGFVALAITGTTLNVVSFIGIIMLMGVIVNNAIVMLDKIAMLKEQGLSERDAIIEGAKTRLRPILMTTLTTVLALIPLALGLGSGGELMQPLGISVIGGLVLGTLVTLILIPIIYSFIRRVPTKPKKQSDYAISAKDNINSVKTN